MIAINKQIRRRRNTGRMFLYVVGVFVMIFVFTLLMQIHKKTGDDVDAASLAGFDPGFIISDWQMGNYTSMSEADIQAFLTSKNSCQNTNYNYYLQLSSGSSYRWHFENGHFVCLSEERFGDGEVIGSGDTAAHIIWQTAQDYKINPQVLLVLLQKETGLITDPIPNNGDYRKATGYGCPDTAACSSKYYGFKNQVRNAAALFRTVLNGGWTNYPLGNNYIQYNPNSGCGGSVVNIRSLATSALYRYTPYQPNAGALAAGYGTAYCGAYGNRNFYLYFQDWFGGVTQEQVKITSIDEFDVTDGVYSILSAGDQTKVISVANESSSDGANVKTGTYRGATIQQWKITKTDDYYTIQNVQTGKVLDVRNGEMVSHINIWQYSGNGSCAQRWKFAKNKDASVVIHNACDLTYVLDLQDGNTNIQIYAKTSYNNSNQNWVLEAVKNEDANIADGIYSILSAGDQTKVISVANESLSDEANVKTGTYRGATIQQWKIAKTDDYYTIQNVQTGKLLSIADNNLNNHVNVWQNKNVDSCGQKWKFVKNNDNSVTIKSVCGVLYVLDLQDGNTNIQIYKKTNYDNTNQKWTLINPGDSAATDDSEGISEEKSIVDKTDVADGIYSILSAGDQTKVISVANESSSDGANVKTGTYRGATIQQWKITKTDDYYTIQNVQTGKVLDVRSGVFEDGTNIWQYASNGTCAQRWNIVLGEDGRVKIYNACDAKYVLDLQNGDTNIQLYRETSYKNTNQEWILKAH